MHISTRWCSALVAVVALAAGTERGGAQTQYYNLDGGRPGRIEDAEVTSLYALEVGLGALQIERLTGGTLRYRTEPRLAYGILPFTDIEMRVPVVHVAPPAGGAPGATGIATVALDAMHAFNLETPMLPAIALGSEVDLPVGALSGPRTSYVIKGLATRTMFMGRLHVNAGAGTYSVRRGAVRADSGSCSTSSNAFRLTLPGQQQCTSGPPLIFDSPCSVRPAGDPSTMERNAMCMGMPSSAPDTEVMNARSQGYRWFAGIGADHAFALQSTLVSADLVVERFVGLYARPDVTAETGLRRQITPRLMLDAGFGWHFAGVIHSASILLGATYEFATPPIAARR